MLATLVIFSFVVAVLGLAGVLLYRLKASRAAVTVPEMDWLDSFSASRYRPMLRMLADEDYEWLAEQGMNKADVQQFRTRRRDVFRTYLDNMVRDFEKLHEAGRFLLLTSEVDRADLAERLVRSRFEFQKTVVMVRCELWLNGFGLKTVNVDRLLTLVEGTQFDVQSLMPSFDVSAA